MQLRGCDRLLLSHQACTSAVVHEPQEPALLPIVPPPHSCLTALKPGRQTYAADARLQFLDKYLIIQTFN